MMDIETLNFLIDKVVSENRYARQARRIARTAVGFSVLTALFAGYYIFNLDKWASKKDCEMTDIQEKFEKLETEDKQRVATVETELAEMKETLKLD